MFVSSVSYINSFIWWIWSNCCWSWNILLTINSFNSCTSCSSSVARFSYFILWEVRYCLTFTILSSCPISVTDLLTCWLRKISYFSTTVNYVLNNWSTFTLNINRTSNITINVMVSLVINTLINLDYIYSYWNIKVTTISEVNSYCCRSLSISFIKTW